LPGRFDNSPEFHKLLAGEPSPSLVRIALEIAGDAYPDLDIGRYITRIDELGERIRARCGGMLKPRKVLGQINWALFVEEGFSGNRENYFDPRNSYLNEVMDRKTGIPISLSLLYWSLADRLGVPLEAANLPAHFMLRLPEPQDPVFIDPFHSGEILDRHGCERRLSELTRRHVELSDRQLEPCPLRGVVARLLRNLKAIYLGTHDFASALGVQRRLVAVADDPREARDLGMICLQLDHVGEAIDPLQSYLAAEPDADDVLAISDLLAAARRSIAQWN
jgi:regulator of sirC expression with transglutaminase-like and TPR domain